MKLLLDENLSRRIVPFLQTDYSGSTQVALIGMEQADDQAIWSYARDNHFVIVTKDANFFDLSLLHGAPPKVIWLKSGNCNKAAVTRLLLENSDQIVSLLRQDHTTCIEIYGDLG
jgi:predicted nuclease of predicted toxin-antitoxin system